MGIIAAVRRTHLLALVLIAAALSGGAGEIAADPAARFGRDLATEMTALLYEASAIDPATQREDARRRQERQRRQAQLDRWFDRMGRQVTLADCRTDADRANYREFAGVMASRELLALDLGERRRCVRQATAYFERLALAYPAALQDVIATNAGQADDELARYFAVRMTAGVRLRARYFGRRRDKVIGSLYVPSLRTIFLNLDQLARSPETFVDSFEHELWHHLLPIVEPRRISDNLWWEGFTEALAECWAEPLHRRSGRRERGETGVEYPVQTAFASLYLGSARRLALRYLAGVDGREEFLAGLAASRGGVAGPVLARAWRRPLAVDPPRRARLETLLGQWGWKEDDGASFSLAARLGPDGLDPDGLDRAFATEKEFLRDLIQALSVTTLQDLSKAIGEEQVLATLELPPHLLANLKKVLAYVSDPRRQYRN